MVICYIMRPVKCLLFDYFCNMTWQLILGLTIPSLVVLLAVYLMFKQYFAYQAQGRMVDWKKEKSQITLPLRLQSYERLILLCERIDIADLILRLKTSGTSASALKSALLIAVQQEFEHNLTQQLYVSEELWAVLQAAKAKSMDIIVIASDGLSADATADEYANQLISIASRETTLPSTIAKRAIKAESSLWL